MCYSRDWDTSERRKRQEAAEAQRKRDGVIKTLLSDAEQKAAQAKTEKAATTESAPSK